MTTPLLVIQEFDQAPKSEPEKETETEILSVLSATLAKLKQEEHSKAVDRYILESAVLTRITALHKAMNISVRGNGLTPFVFGIIDNLLHIAISSHFYETTEKKACYKMREKHNEYARNIEIETLYSDCVSLLERITTAIHRSNYAECASHITAIRAHFMRLHDYIDNVADSVNHMPDTVRTYIELDKEISNINNGLETARQQYADLVRLLQNIETGIQLLLN